MKTHNGHTLRDKPPRAEPLRQDRPARGDRRLPAGDSARPGPPSDNAAKRLKRQVDTAVDNTHEGYD